MKAHEYKVDFGYMAQDGEWYGPKGKVGIAHLGNDRPTPSGVEIEVGDTIIGLTGSSGMVSGPHLHTQAWKGTTTNTYNPSSYEFRPGTVVDVGYASQWGNYVTILVDGVNITYAHLSRISVRKGQVIKAVGINDGKGSFMTPDQAADVARNILRVLNSEAKGWNMTETHEGKFDDRERKYFLELIKKHGDPLRALAAYSQQAWDEGQQYRRNKRAWKQAHDNPPVAKPANVKKLTKGIYEVE